ncbi:type II toxin-antitoxin system RelE/ParE family toxin [Pseudoxanthomonas sp.]|uniref:type II toxin-antitoxin system RelE/ParE family toxin n=1 Tax=Pseudoxanthomonas sp. TaxID=1871049 RepID=UPI003F8229A9
MSLALNRLETWLGSRSERLQSSIAAISSALLHLLLLLVLLYSSKPVVTSPQSAASGGRVKVDFIGEPQESDQSTPAPPSPPPTRASDPVPPARAASRLRSTLVDRADNPIPPDAPVPSDSLSARRAPSPSERRNESRPQPPSPSSPARRRPETWTGRPPGLIEEDLAPQNAGLANSPAIRNGRGRDMTANGPSMELGGYLVYYDVLSEERLRAWARHGMKELSIPLPGTRYYMVCPLEIALRRGSGKCRALDPDSPEMAAIGDAREAVTMLQVYKQGELVWRGPGPYR